MMSQQITKILLNGKSIGTKPLMLDDTLASIRAKIKDRTKVPFIFLNKNGENIKNVDEFNLKLEDISKEKIINIKDVDSQIKIILDDSQFFFMKCKLSQKLNEIRNILIKKVKVDFLFLDIEKLEIMKNNEIEYKVSDILKDNSLKLKTQGYFIQTPERKIINILKPEINKKKRNIDLSKDKIITKKENLTFYKYSNLPRKMINELVYLYFYDNYDARDYKNAYVILFCGKTGDGKTTAINAFFNIIKGITLEDNFRFILISEPEKEKGQAESQTDGVHIYYLKDYDNKPVILIDSQGYGDTRGKQYDEMIEKAFQYIFSHIIGHINAVGFIVKSNTSRIDISTKYIFSSVTSLFSQDISENL